MSSEQDCKKECEKDCAQACADKGQCEKDCAEKCQKDCAQACADKGQCEKDCAKNKCQKDCAASCIEKTQCCKVRLHFFNVRGRAEPIRLCLALAKANWEDVRYTREEWCKVKSFFPLGQMPVLEWTDKDGKAHHLTQMGTILRAVAHWFHLGGKSPCEAARVDEVSEVTREVGELIQCYHFEQDGERKDKLFAKLRDEIIPRNFAYLEKKLHEHGGKFMAGGDGLTYADLGMVTIVDSIRSRHLATEEYAKTNLPGLYALVHSVREQPEIKAWLACRPHTDF